MTTRLELKSFLDELKARFLENPAATGVETAISARIDEIIIRDIWGDRKPPASFALLAVGGYGRGTVHPDVASVAAAVGPGRDRRERQLEVHRG